MTVYDLTLTYAESQTEKGVCANKRSNPRVDVGQKLKRYLEFFSIYIHFPKLKRRTWIWV